MEPLSNSRVFVSDARMDGLRFAPEFATGRERRTLRGHKDVVNGVALAPDGKEVVFAFRDQAVKVRCNKRITPC